MAAMWAGQVVAGDRPDWPTRTCDRPQSDDLSQGGDLGARHAVGLQVTFTPWRTGVDDPIKLSQQGAHCI
jgi:hypothetical protein